MLSESIQALPLITWEYLFAFYWMKRDMGVNNNLA